MALSEPSRSRWAVATEQVLATHVTRGDHVLIDGFPCRIVAAAFAKTGKHGSRKAILTGVDLLTGRKRIYGGPGDTKLDSFKPDRREYTVIDGNDEHPAEIHYLDDNGAAQVAGLDHDRAKHLAAMLEEAGEERSVIVGILCLPCPARRGDIQTVESLTFSK